MLTTQTHRFLCRHHPGISKQHHKKLIAKIKEIDAPDAMCLAFTPNHHYSTQMVAFFFEKKELSSTQFS